MPTSAARGCRPCCTLHYTLDKTASFLYYAVRPEESKVCIWRSRRSPGQSCDFRLAHSNFLLGTVRRIHGLVLRLLFIECHFFPIDYLLFILAPKWISIASEKDVSCFRRTRCCLCLSPRQYSVSPVPSLALYCYRRRRPSLMRSSSLRQRGPQPSRYQALIRSASPLPASSPLPRQGPHILEMEAARSDPFLCLCLPNHPHTHTYLLPTCGLSAI